MGTATIGLPRVPTAAAPVRTGLALAATVAVFYSLCAFVWLLAPGPFLGFMNSLFHGLDFGLLVRPAAFAWSGYVEAVTVMTAWAFLAGTFFGWVRELLAG